MGLLSYFQEHLLERKNVCTYAFVFKAIYMNNRRYGLTTFLSSRQLTKMVQYRWYGHIQRLPLKLVNRSTGTQNMCGLLAKIFKIINDCVSYAWSQCIKEYSFTNKQSSHYRQRSAYYQNIYIDIIRHKVTKFWNRFHFTCDSQ